MVIKAFRPKILCKLRYVFGGEIVENLTVRLATDESKVGDVVNFSSGVLGLQQVLREDVVELDREPGP